MQWLTAGDWAVIAQFFAIPALLFILADQLQHRGQRKWTRQYFHEGGLARSLIARWRGTPRLTDQREDK